MVESTSASDQAASEKTEREKIQEQLLQLVSEQESEIGASMVLKKSDDKKGYASH